VDKIKYVSAPNLSGDTILYLGRLDAQKGIEGFFDEVVKYKDELAKAGLHVVIAGSGMSREKACVLDYDGVISYAGRLSGDDKMEAIKNAKYMVFPSLYEPWGLSLNEGLASGKICVASMTSGHFEQIKDKKNGIFAKPGQFIQMILELEKNHGFQKKLSSQAPGRARDIRQHFKDLGGLFHDLLRTS
jgi:glycosyltransferase involved in cell wall biosynthesis